MGIDADDSEYDYEFSCPKCGSNEVVIEDEGGYFSISSCKKCGYKKSSP